MSGLRARGLLRNASCAILGAFILVQRKDGVDAAFNDLTGSMGDHQQRQSAPPPPAVPPATVAAYEDIPPPSEEAEAGAAAAGALGVSQGVLPLQGVPGHFPSLFPSFGGAPNPVVGWPPFQPQASAAPPAAGPGPGIASGFLSFPGGIPNNPAAGVLGAGVAGIGGWGPPSSRESRNALAAGLTLHTPESGDVLTAPCVSDTSVPVGFFPSCNGVYKVPRFPSSVHSLSEPSEEAIKNCAVRVSASQMTNGFSDNLKSGGVNVTGNAHSQLLRIIATSSPRYTSKLGSPIVLFQRVMGMRLSYEVKVAVPKGCVLLHGDPRAMAVIRRDGSYVVGAVIIVPPDVPAEYTSSVAAVPADLVAFAAGLPPDSNFQPAGHCVFVAHFTTTPDNIRLFASLTQVRVEAQSALGTETLQLEIPLVCLPQSLHRTAIWATPLHNGTAAIVAFSPPPKPEPEWFVVRTSGDEAALQRLVGVRP